MGHSTTRATPTYLQHSFSMRQYGDVHSQTCTYVEKVAHIVTRRLLALSKMASLLGSTLAKGLHGNPNSMEPCQESQCRSCLPVAQLGLRIEPKPRCMPLTEKQTGDPLVHRPML